MAQKLRELLNQVVNLVRRPKGYWRLTNQGAVLYDREELLDALRDGHL